MQISEWKSSSSVVELRKQQWGDVTEAPKALILRRRVFLHGGPQPQWGKSPCPPVIRALIIIIIIIIKWRAQIVNTAVFNGILRVMPVDHMASPWKSKNDKIREESDKNHEEVGTCLVSHVPISCRRYTAFVQSTEILHIGLMLKNFLLALCSLN